MKRLIGTMLMASALTASSTFAADTIVTQTEDYPAFSKRFCAADHKLAQIFIVPVTVFTNYKEITCEDGASSLRMSEPMEDPGHTIFNIDPPHGAKSGLDCDGKADTGMTVVAINCIPADMEVVDHKKT